MAMVVQKMSILTSTNTHTKGEDKLKRIESLG